MSAAPRPAPTDHLDDAANAKLAELADDCVRAYIEHEHAGDHATHMSRAEAAAWIARLRASSVTPSMVRALEAYFTAARRDAEDRRREDRRKQTGPRKPKPGEGSDLSEMLRDLGADVPDGLAVPPDYSVQPGEFGGRVLKLPSSDGGAATIECPLVAIVGVAQDYDSDDQQTVTLGWLGMPDHTGARPWQTATVPRAVAFDRAKLVQLANRGAPVDSTSASKMVSWLSAQLAASSIPLEMSMRRFGWCASGRSFLLGAEAIGDPVRYVPAGDGEQSDAAALDCRGTEAAWIRDVWGPLKSHPASLAILAALSAPVLGPLKSQGGWTLDIGAETGTGKSTALSAAASVYGNPRGLLLTWPTTWPAARARLETWHSLPAIFDDTKRAAQHPDIIKRVIYAANDASSQRLGDGSGGTRAAREVCTVAISTGEHTAASQCGDARGAMARCVTIKAHMIPAGSHDLVARVEAGMTEHYGHIGRRWIAWLVDHIGERFAWRERHRAASATIRLASEEGTEARIAGFLAHLQITAELAHEALGMDFAAALDYAREAVRDGAASRDVPSAALEAVIAAQLSRPGDLFCEGRTEPRQQWIGGMTRDCPWSIAPAFVKEALGRAGFVHTEALESWRRRGWLHITEQNRFESKITLPGGNRPRFICLTAEAAALFVGGGAYPEHLSYPEDPMNPR